jgi:hypothetical protein
MKIQSFMAIAVLAFSFSAVSSWASDADDSTDNSVTSTDQGSATGSTFSLDQILSDPGHGGPGGGGHGGGGNPGGHGGPAGPGHGGHPYPVHGGHYPWPHWPHPIFDRPVYGWDWGHLRVVTCTATDDNGDFFPVTEDGYNGFEYQNRLVEIEDAAIDRCYNETNGDESCRLFDCEAGY